MTERASDDEITNSAAANDEQAQETDPEKRSKFGTRFLTDPQNVFQHNAWDNVVWDEEQETMAQQITEKHIKSQVSDEKKDQFEKEADQFWDKFYGQHQNRFFKDRHWLFTEFPELYGKSKDSHDSVASNATSCVPGTEQVLSGSKCRDGSNNDFKETNSFNMLEIGCGVGNTVFPVLKTNNDPNLMMYCCDFSHTAIDIVKNHPDYDSKRCHAFVHDLTDDTATMPFPPGSLDVIIMIFVLSAVKPDKMQESVLRLASYLKPGGIILFRDYGRYDLAQLRFKEGRCMSENFYVRGDGTFVYFFTQEELREIFTKAGLTEKENLVDRRLQVNRSRQLKMYRVWIQCKYIKPLLELECDLNAPVSS